MKSFDRRYVKTEKAIQEEFISLLKDLSISDIGVEDVCEEADINKSTFYLHYQSIDMLAAALEDAFLFDLSKELGGSLFFDSPQGFLRTVLRFAKTDKKRLFAIFKCDRYRFNEKVASFSKAYLPKGAKGKEEAYRRKAALDSVVSVFRSAAKDGFRCDEGSLLTLLLSLTQ